MEEFIQEFKEESRSIVERVQQSLLSIDIQSDYSSVIEEIFRGVHTLKGSARMFGFENIEKLTHELENRFDQIREGQITLDKALVNLSMSVMDQVMDIIEGSEDEAKTNALISDIENFSADEQTGDVRIMQILFTPDSKIYERGVNPVAILDEIKELGDTHIFTLFTADTLENMEEAKTFEAAFEIFLNTSASNEDVEDVFLFLGEAEFSLYTIDGKTDTADSIAQRAEALLNDKVALSKGESLQRMETIHTLLSQTQTEAEQTTHVEEIAEKEQIEVAQTNKVEDSSLSFINVKLERLDDMMKLVSELVTLKAQLNYRAQVLEDPELTDAVDHLEKLSNKFKDNAFSMRLVPLQILSLKFQRLVRDLGETLDKEVNLITQGLDTEFDKSIINEIEGPLMHIIRNAIDHGLETKAEREKLGKPTKGLLKISSFYEGANVFIQVQDDGAGLDLKKIKKAAIKKGIIKTGAKLTEKEAIDLIFEPGFTTHNQATTTSGRGVGMDVVKNKLKQLRGSIDITTEPGLGTTFTMRLPLSLSILDVLHFKVGNVNYLVPHSEVVQCFSERLNDDVIKRSGFNLQFKKDLLPHLQLESIFEEKATTDAEPSIVILQKNDEMISLEVHEIIGEDQLVIKPVDDALKSLSYMAGVSVLGNGELAFLLDSFRLRNSLNQHPIDAKATSK